MTQISDKCLLSETENIWTHSYCSSKSTDFEISDSIYFALVPSHALLAYSTRVATLFKLLFALTAEVSGGKITPNEMFI